MQGQKMKTIGMIGGISWESTHEYYRLINKEVNKRLGGTHSAPILMYSFDFDEIMEYINADDNKSIGKRLVEQSRKLEEAGAELLMLCANTAHRWADRVASKVNIPLIHIADATGQAIREAGLTKVLLLGTNYTMEREFIKGKLAADFNIEVVVPEKEDREGVSRIIYDELIRGKFLDNSRHFLLDVIQRHPHVQAVILGCTELPLIVKQEDVDVPLFNTTKVHAMAVLDFAMK
jgi:aspartate racemase